MQSAERPTLAVRARTKVTAEDEILLRGRQGARRGGEALTDDEIEDRKRLIVEFEQRREMLLRHLQLLSDTDPGASTSEVAHTNPNGLAVFSAIRSGLANRLLTLLLRHNDLANCRDYHGSTPLHIAAAEGRMDMIHILLNFRAEVQAKDYQDRTATEVAQANHHTAAARLLLSYAARRLRGELVEDVRTLAETPTETGLATSLGSSSLPSGEGDSGHRLFRAPAPRHLQDDPALAHESSFGTTPKGSVDRHSDTPRLRGRAAPTTSSFCTVSDTRSAVLFMVGLPGRGKSFISKRISRYLNWKGVPCRVFNAGDYRRTVLGAAETRSASFFDPNNPEGVALRERMAEMACEDLKAFLEEKGFGVGILDATNTTVARRRKVMEYFQHAFEAADPPLRFLFIESICDDQEMIRENILRAKCGNADYSGIDVAAVVQDFEKRIEQYVRVYEPLTPAEGLPFIKLCNVKERIVIHRVHGGIPSKLTYFLLNLYHLAFPIYLSMPGETQWQRNHTFGGTDTLTDAGREYAVSLAGFIRERLSTSVYLTVLYGTNAASQETVKIVQQVLAGQSLGERGSTSGARALGREIEGSLVDTSLSPTLEIPLDRPVCDADCAHHAERAAEATLRVRFAGMRCLEGVNYGMFTGMTPSEARASFPKLFSKLFIEDLNAASDPTSQTKTSAPVPIRTPATGGSSPENPPSGFQPTTAPLIIPSHHLVPISLPDALHLTPDYRMTFPRGESCRQVNVRLERALFEIMRIDGPVVIIAPLQPVQGIATFLRDGKPEESPNLMLDLHTVIEHGTSNKTDVTHCLGPSPGRVAT